jgi:hypothetical protein
VPVIAFLQSLAVVNHGHGHCNIAHSVLVDELLLQSHIIHDLLLALVDQLVGDFNLEPGLNLFALLKVVNN